MPSALERPVVVVRLQILHVGPWLRKQRARVQRTLDHAPPPDPRIPDLQQRLWKQAAADQATRTHPVLLPGARTHATPLTLPESIARGSMRGTGAPALAPREDYAATLFELHHAGPLTDPAQKDALLAKAAKLEKRMEIKTRYDVGMHAWLYTLFACHLAACVPATRMYLTLVTVRRAFDGLYSWDLGTLEARNFLALAAEKRRLKASFDLATQVNALRAVTAAFEGLVANDPRAIRGAARRKATLRRNVQRAYATYGLWNGVVKHKLRMPQPAARAGPVSDSGPGSRGMAGAMSHAIIRDPDAAAPPPSSRSPPAHGAGPRACLGSTDSERRSAK